MRVICIWAVCFGTWTARGAGAPADGPVVEIVTAFSPTVVPLPADEDFSVNGLITQEFGKNNGPLEYAVHLNVRGACAGKTPTRCRRSAFTATSTGFGRRSNSKLANYAAWAFE
jgi:hypothetical protein